MNKLLATLVAAFFATASFAQTAAPARRRRSGCQARRQG